MHVTYAAPRSKSLLTLPFRLLWRLATFIEKALGIFLLLVAGLVLMILGLVLSATLLGAVVGIPLFLLGLLLTLRALY